MAGWRNIAVQRYLIEVTERLYSTYDRADQIPAVIEDLKREAFRPLANKTLIRLFLLPDTSNASLISVAQYAALYKELLECDAAFTLALLAMLIAVRDTGAIEHVERLSKGGGCLGRRNLVVREAAAHCLEILHGAI